MAKKSADPNASDAGNPELGNDGDAGGNASTGFGAEIGGLAVTDPASIGGGVDGPGPSEQPKRGRGRPAGSGGGKRGPKPKTSAASETSVKGLAKIFVSLHAMAAGFTGAAELNIDEAEAKTIADAAADVASHYSVTADPKTMAWVNLAAALGMVYGPRFGAIKLRVASEKRGKMVQRSAAPTTPASVVEGRFPLKAADAPLPGGFEIPAVVQ